MSFADVGPWALVALFLLAVVVVAGGVIGLCVALRGTSEGSRPDIIRALGDFFRALLDALFRRRRK
jgi:hypothetical protein